MIRLLPSTSSQSFNIIPRDIPLTDAELTDINVTITEDGTGVTETKTSITAALNGNYVQITVAFSILNADKAYFLEFTKGGVLWYRDKVYATSQTSKKTNHTLNTSKYSEYTDSASDEYIVL